MRRRRANIQRSGSGEQDGDEDRCVQNIRSSDEKMDRSTAKSALIFLFVAAVFAFFSAFLWEGLFREPVLLFLTARLSLSPHLIESLIIFPCALLVPITHVIGSLRYNNEKSLLSSPLRGGLTHICLQAATWTLWAAALSILVLSIFFSPSSFGLISSSAMLGLFAQGMMVTSIFTHRSSPASSNNLASFDTTDDVDLTHSELVSADEWSNSPRRKRLNSFSKQRQRRRKRDFALFIAMSYLLLQAPHFVSFFLSSILSTCVDCFTGQMPLSELPPIAALVTTLGVPLFTHGVGGQLFNKEWSFHHAFSGGTAHIAAQAIGWILVTIAAVFQIHNILYDNHWSLNAAQNLLGWVAEGFLLTSIFVYEPRKNLEDNVRERSPLEFVVSVCQDLFMTNLHWLFVFWFASAPMGFDLFSINPTRDLFNCSAQQGAINFFKLLFVCCLPSLFFPYSAERHEISWKRPFAKAVKILETALLSEYGLFRDSRIVFEESEDKYSREGIMFGLTPHGTLPLSTWALWHQASHIFDHVCLFFGSQVGIIPGYRLWTGARGGCMTIDKKNLLRVMNTRQNVALVPGGVKEMMICQPFATDINVSIKHKGFIRIALQQGYDLVPVLMLHENDFYNNPLKDFQEWTYKLTKVPAGLPYYTNRWYLPMSNRLPLRVVIGKIIKVKKTEEPSDEIIESTHRLFYSEVVRCWNKHKEELGFNDRKLVFVI